MNSKLRTPRRWYGRYVGLLSRLQHPLLLACRLYWGGLFIFTGYNKLSHLALTAQRFADWHIPAPYANAVAAGTTEMVCGSLLVIGLASRFITIPLIVTMIVAYRTAHIDEVTDLYSFVTAAPFLHLMTCTLVLVFGPGAFSIDYLIGRFFFGSSDDPPAAEADRESKTTGTIPTVRN
ncbi:MAG TPA: DoxX family protein [Pirellulales bacterium]|jgi:putative oxidoreductase|nr:DoxX family protein [Pirellulales bacterium]